MKLTLAILLCLGVAGVSQARPRNTTNPVDPWTLGAHQFLLEMLYRVDQPLEYEKRVKFDGLLVADKKKYKVFDGAMEDFYISYRAGRLLPRGEFYGALKELHAYQTLGLFGFFFYIKDFDTFVTNVAWARINVNEGMFVHALLLTAKLQFDMKDYLLPPIYEILPQSFLNSKFIVSAEKFDPDTWNRQIMLEKELKTVYDQKYPTDVIGKNQFYLRSWKVWQWWKLMGLDEDWHLESQTVLRDYVDALKNDPRFKAVWDGVPIYWHPVDYTRDIEIFNDETKLSYFTEDVGWNAYWYNLNLDYPRFFYGKQLKLDQGRRGEFWFYSVQQFLARYYMERLSQGLGEVDELSYYGVVKTGYNPQLIAYNGAGFSTRKNYWEVQSYGNVALLNKIVSIENRFFDTINSAKDVSAAVESFMKDDGNIVDLYNLIANFLTGTDIDSWVAVPNLLLNPETMMRDPITYQIFKRIIEMYYKYKNQLAPYTREELIAPGVKILDVEVSSLKTYFDFVDIDVSTLLTDKITLKDYMITWEKTLLARQLRLNHKPFTYDIKVTSEKVQKVVVRTFIAPDFDQNGQKIDLFLNRETIFQLDEFLYDLSVGENVITRSSKDFSYTVGDQITYTELYKYVFLAYEGTQEYPLDIAKPRCGFPNRLLLPKGSAEGLPMKMFFLISAYTGNFKKFLANPYQICGVHYTDNAPFGYPFDRKINNVNDFLVPNLYIEPVEIYHMDKLKKYYPKKYENFGNFDYTF